MIICILAKEWNEQKKGFHGQLMPLCVLLLFLVGVSGVLLNRRFNAHWSAAPKVSLPCSIGDLVNNSTSPFTNNTALIAKNTTLVVVDRRGRCTFYSTHDDKVVLSVQNPGSFYLLSGYYHQFFYQFKFYDHEDWGPIGLSQGLFQSYPFTRNLYFIQPKELPERVGNLSITVYVTTTPAITGPENGVSVAVLWITLCDGYLLRECWSSHKMIWFAATLVIIVVALITIVTFCIKAYRKWKRNRVERINGI